MSANPRFLRPPDPPRSSQPAERPITQTELVNLWRRIGVIQKAQRDTRVSRADLIGLVSLVAMLAWCLGYYMGH